MTVASKFIKIRSSCFYIVDVKKKIGSKNKSFSFLPHCATAKKCPRGKCDLNKKSAPKEEKADTMCDPGPPCSTPAPLAPSCCPPYGPYPPYGVYGACGPYGGPYGPPCSPYGAPCGYPGPYPGPQPGCPVPGYGECRHAQHDYFHSMENYHK